MDGVIEWLMEGDPAIRWQVMRDLLGEPEGIWQAERRRTLESGWGARFLTYQDADGIWGGGIYSPKWTSSTYTLLTLTELGLPPDYEPSRRGTRLVLDQQLGQFHDSSFSRKLTEEDRCIAGMELQLAVYFGLGDERVEALVGSLLADRMPDGGWNCRRRPWRKDSYSNPHHSSFHTTLNVLAGLREYIEHNGPRSAEAVAAEQDALELLLQHHLYRSSRSGEEINRQFSLITHPYRWHYDVLRGLEYFARVKALRDERLQDPIELLKGKRRADGTWPNQYKYGGKVFFNMEKGSASRWNTLRALRVLRWWEVK
jgi:hypothetical protein